MSYEKIALPPLNFSMVENGIYRSGFPNIKNFHFLENLKLNSILYLCHQTHPSYQEALLSFCKMFHIQLFICPIDGNKEPFIGIDTYAMDTALDTITTLKNHPILIHCTKGTHRTGCVIGCLRKKQGWSLTSIFDEYCRFANTTIRLLDQQFIEFYQGGSKTEELVEEKGEEEE